MLKDKLEEIADISFVTPSHLQHEKIGPRNIRAYEKLRSENSSTGGYLILLLGYARSPFRDIECYLRIVVGLDEEDIQLILKQYNSNSLSIESLPGIYTIRDISEAVYTMRDLEGNQQIEFDDISVKTKLISTRFDGTFGMLRFGEKSFFNTSLGFTAVWDYKPTNASHADSSDVMNSDEILNLSTISKTHLKCDVMGGSIVGGLRQQILFGFVLDKPPGYKVFCEPEKNHYKKIDKSVLNTITFYLENDNHEEIIFDGKNLTFTLQLIKI